MVNNSAGPLAGYLAGYRAELERLGYAASTAGQLVGLMEGLDGWLSGRGGQTESLSVELLEEFLDDFRRESGWWQPTTATLKSHIVYLQRCGAMSETPLEPATGPYSAVLGRFTGYLVDERGLTASTAAGYAQKAGGLLAVVGKDVGLLTGADVLGFLDERNGSGTGVLPAHELTGLRAFLSWAHLEGLAGTDLTAVLPRVARHGTGKLPDGIGQERFQALLDSCDRQTNTGRRDYAVLLLLGRLGMRVGEAAGLLLDDVDWRAGQLWVRGKGHRQESLPIPVEVGAALAEYLTGDHRRLSEVRQVFRRVHAPLVELSSNGIAEIVYTAARRAGLEPVHAHQLRHTAATAMLAAGASWAELGQVLRHHSPATTAIYARVDDTALALLARPWPGARP